MTSAARLIISDKIESATAIKALNVITVFEIFGFYFSNIVVLFWLSHENGTLDFF